MASLLAKLALAAIPISVMASGLLASPAQVQPNALNIENVQEIKIPIQTLTAEVTGYSSEPEQTNSEPFISANGSSVFDGLIACPRWLPFGTVVRIDDIEYYCGDRMNIRYDDRFDIWFMEKSLAIEWGIQTKEVEIMSIPTLYEQVKDMDGKDGGECVSFLHWFLRLKEPLGNAKDIVPNETEPKIGRIVLFNYKVGHAALIIDIKDGILILAESNYNLDSLIKIGREVPIDNPSIKGYLEI